MADNDKIPGVLEADIPPSWGFHLLQELHRMEDKLEAKIDTTNTRIDALDTKFEQKFDALDAKFTHRIDSLQYWYWATLAAIIVGFVISQNPFNKGARHSCRPFLLSQR